MNILDTIRGLFVTIVLKTLPHKGFRRVYMSEAIGLTYLKLSDTKISLISPLTVNVSDVYASLLASKHKQTTKKTYES